MSLLLICPTKDPTPWVNTIHELDDAIDVHVWPAPHKPEDVTFAVLWNHPQGILAEYPNLKGIASMGAGIDHILNDPGIPHDLPVARIVDPGLVQSMSEYVLTAVLQHFRDFPAYQNNQQNRTWDTLPPKDINKCSVGILGLGKLGYDAAKKLHSVGFNVSGWSRQRKEYPELAASYAGWDELPDFLRKTNVLICLLPLTTETKGILNAQLFAQLPDQAYLINVARGAHLVEEDLLSAIKTGKLSGACLDVFVEEPLPDTHPFWDCSEITITPHIASITNPVTASRQVVENYHRAVNNQQLLNSVDLERQY